jgi:hypothetical protein
MSQASVCGAHRLNGSRRAPALRTWRTLPKAYESRGNPWFRQSETLPRVLAQDRREPMRRGESCMTGFSSMGRPKCVNPFPLGESQCIATAPHAPIRPPIIGGWSAAPKASIEPPYRMRSGSMPVMQDEQETANQRPWRRESDRRGRNRIEQLRPMCQFPVATNDLGSTSLRYPSDIPTRVASRRCDSLAAFRAFLMFEADTFPPPRLFLLDRFSSEADGGCSGARRARPPYYEPP